ncbi:MAG: hypothetical protein K8F92_07085 [Hyphomicrobium sp.]|uniref:hypothetical protein n=1 Tax=Hyphomicrobium sp. TaxID=82 RepID=UPI00132CBCF6|nr:hypothetical protein [Hyphomicrobium sp.]KAB2944106.1 MAG: hypothetical protein F9K20_01370 [Hyphomicrobium sp.]MBZ0209401.1 hypothetical protein [Hyphomicrobium sp.]
MGKSTKYAIDYSSQLPETELSEDDGLRLLARELGVPESELVSEPESVRADEKTDKRHSRKR